jgi:hypothetical protein
MQGQNVLMGVTMDMSQCHAQVTDVKETERDRKQQTGAKGQKENCN